MLGSLRRLSIRKKIVAIAVISGGVALMLLETAGVIYDLRVSRSSTIQSLRIIGEIIAANSTAALEFRDVRAGRERLGALRSNPRVTSAAIYRIDGELFASYLRKDLPADAPVQPHRPDGVYLERGHLIVFGPVMLAGERIGTIYIESDLADERLRLRNGILLGFAVFLASALVAIFLASHLQTLISGPLLRLAGTAARVSAERNYAIRAVKETEDELGALVDRFNEMLGQIQDRDRALREAHDELEVRVVERTVDLRNEVGERMRAEQRLHSLVEHLPHGVVVLDRDMRIIVENRIARGLLPVLGGGAMGGVLRELGGKPVEELLGAGEAPERHELQVEGSQRGVFEIAAGRLGDEDEPSASILVIHDATKERDAEARMEQQERLAAIGQLAAGIAHDFNNLLQAILMQAELMGSNPHLPGPLHPRIAGIAEQARRGARLVQQILDFSRRSIVTKHVVDLGALVQEVMSMLERTIPESITMAIDRDSSPLPISADTTQLQQLVTNLAVNARDAMPDGGRLRIGVRRVTVTERDTRLLPEMSPGNWACLTVSDTGCGIAEEIRSRVYEPFFTTKERARGTGLGLAQVYGIVKQHGALIDFETDVGKGTTFTVCFPIIETQVDEGCAAGEKPKIGSGETLLVVEDDPGILEVTSEGLGNSGYRVLSARSGEEALDVFEANRERISLVISDVVMPGMGGLILGETMQRIRPGIRFLFMSGYPIDAEAVLSSGSAEWIQKPFTLDELARAVNRALDRRAEVGDGQCL